MKKKNKKRKFKFRRSKNLFIQLAIMLPLSLVQNVGGLMIVLALCGTWKEEGIGALIAMSIFGFIIALLPAIPMVKLKGYNVYEEGWNESFQYDMTNASITQLITVHDVLEKYYKLSVPISARSEESRGYYIDNIFSCDWSVCSSDDYNLILDELASCKVKGGYEMNPTAELAIWVVLSPVAFICQWIAVCFAIAQLWSRRIYSSFGELPFPELCLQCPFLQTKLHFLFNVVFLNGFKFKPWMKGAIQTNNYKFEEYRKAEEQ